MSAGRPGASQPGAGGAGAGGASGANRGSARRGNRGWTKLTWDQRAAARRTAGQDGRDGDEDRSDILLARGTGYTIFSYLIAGMIAYGGIGWLIGRAAGITMLFPIGMLVGLVISLGWIIYRYGVKGGGQ